MRRRATPGWSTRSTAPPTSPAASRTSASPIAFVRDGIVEIGAIYSPALDELYFARRGHGATTQRRADPGRSDRRLRRRLRRARLVEPRAERSLPRGDGRGPGRGANVRRGASGALGLAYVADGRSDAYAELHMNAWDCLAGLLLVKEAGGRVGPFLQTPAPSPRAAR